MRVLLTGASGFIGSHVARLVTEEGHELVALVRHGSDLWRLDGFSERVRLLEGELETVGSIAASLRRRPPAVCLHLAWYAEPGGKCLWADENLDCLTGSLSLLRVLRDCGCSRLLIAGTSVEYDSTSGYVSEASPIRPANLYAAAKHSLFLTASNFGQSAGFRVAAARIFSVYGPREDPRRLVPYVITKLLGGEPCELTRGEQIRDYSHVEDAAGALWAIAKSSVEGPVNVGSSRPVSVASVARKLGEILGRTELLRFGARPSPTDDPAFLVANTDRLRNEVGFTPRFDLAAGLAHTVDFWRSLKRDQL